VTRTGDGLLKGQNFLIFPAGRCKTTPVEKIDGKSAVPLIIRQCPNVNIVLVRITGLWGSRFSCATKSSERWATRSVRSLDMVWQTLKMIFLNALFFIPKRTVVVEFAPAPADFPRFGNRLEIGRYLENYFNAEWGPLGEPLYRVPEYFWKEHSRQHEYVTRKYIFDLNQVPKPLRNSVVAMVADKANLDCKDVDFDMHLGRDLGFDSLNIAEILTYLEARYGIKRLVPEDLTTVGHLIAVTAKIPITCELQTGSFHEISDHQPLSQRLAQATSSFFRFGR
jgi:long-chain-fatty-acid--[acyl-carrier-protein] ligase